MFINETKPGELDALKEVKVKIPVRYHMILLSMKVLQGKQISDAVSEALEAYFDKLRAQSPQGRVPGLDLGPKSSDL